MRKVILNLAMSLDGFIEGSQGEVDWCIMEEDMQFASYLETVDSLFYGRVSYDAWGNFKPAVEASEEERFFWERIHAKKKYVFSHQARVDDSATFINGDIAQQVAAIKAEEGKDIWLYGGANLIQHFIAMNLIDVYKISIHPLALGSGKPLFENLTQRLNLKLIESRTFQSGVVELCFIPQK